MIIFLDESGCLGFNFEHPTTSSHLVIAALICHRKNVAYIKQALRKTISHKCKNPVHELKGGNSDLQAKNYFLKQLEKSQDWYLATIVADKKAFIRRKGLKENIDKHMFYDELIATLLQAINLNKNNADQFSENVNIVIDKSKNPKQVKIFNRKIIPIIESKLTNTSRCIVSHHHSHSEPGLQAVDLFCWGISRKYQSNDVVWYDRFAHKITKEIIWKYERAGEKKDGT